MNSARANSQTLAEKILAAHCGRDVVSPGELVNVRLDVIMANDITAPIAIREFRRIGVKKVFDPQRIILLPDHFTPNKDIQSAEQSKILKEFAREQGVIYFEQGRVGIEHVLLPEQGLVAPGEVVIGADSHTCTYGALGIFATGVGSTDVAAAMATGELWMKVPHSLKFIYHGQLPRWVSGKDLILYTIGQIGVEGATYAAMEFTGEAVAQLSVEARLTMSNMAIEAGGKAGMFEVDEKTREYVSSRVKRPFTIRSADPDAQYSQVFEWDVSKLEPMVTFPHLPSNARPVSQAGEVPIDQVIIGSCTNGRIEDLRIAASLLAGHQVHERVRCVIIPGSPTVYLQAMAEGLLETFVRAGAAVSTPTCGPCLGGYMGILAAGERCVSTTNRNFVGRMGHPQSEVYLAGPAVAAASAIAGRVAGPDAI